METIKLVIFAGEEYYLVGVGEIANYLGDGTEVAISISALNKVETTIVKGIQRAMWVPTAELYPKVSGIDFRYSEWFVGVDNGNV